MDFVVLWKTNPASDMRLHIPPIIIALTGIGCVHQVREHKQVREVRVPTKKPTTLPKPPQKKNLINDVVSNAQYTITSTNTVEYKGPKKIQENAAKKGNHKSVKVTK